jgi:hypothetical protein
MVEGSVPLHQAESPGIFVRKTRDDDPWRVIERAPEPFAIAIPNR